MGESNKFLSALPYIGVVIGFVLLYLSASMQNVDLAYAALAVLAISVWSMGTMFVRFAIRTFSAILKS